MTPDDALWHPTDNPIPTPAAQKVLDNAMIDALEAASVEASKKLTGPEITYTFDSGFQTDTGWQGLKSGTDTLAVGRYVYEGDEYYAAEIFNDSLSRSQIEGEFKLLAELARDNQIADAK